MNLMCHESAATGRLAAKETDPEISSPTSLIEEEGTAAIGRMKPNSERCCQLERAQIRKQAQQE